MKMSGMMRRVFLGALFVLFGQGPALFAAERVPERLVYDLSWMGIPVGTATQEITEQGEMRRITSLARSNSWLSTFYPVEDRTESTLAKRGDFFPGESRSFRMVFKEGRQTRDREITFEPAGKAASYHDRITGEKVEVPVAEHTLDICASFFYVRHLGLEVGKSVVVHVLDAKQPRSLEVKVLKKEQVKTPVGEFSTIVIRPLVFPEGVFEGKEGTTIWLTDDERRVPVKVQTRVRVGSVTAVLAGGMH